MMTTMIVTVELKSQKMASQNEDQANQRLTKIMANEKRAKKQMLEIKNGVILI